MNIKNISGTILLALSFVAFSSCEDWPGMEYTIEPKEMLVDDQLIFVDGFLQEGVPVYQGTEGDENDPADRLAIPVRNGFGRELTFVFVDNSDKYGIRIKQEKVKADNIGDRQYFYFDMEGTPKSATDGVIPISFDVLDENGVSLLGTITKTVNVWDGDMERPDRDMIPTVQKPFIFHHAELNWVNQYHEDPASVVSLYAGTPIPTSSFTLSGITYNTSVNLHYNSILIANGALTPEFTEVVSGGVTNNVLTLLVPDAENLGAHPEWFTLSDGTTSDVWDPSENSFMHGKNSKPISISMYDENASLLISGNNRSRPFSSLTWNVTDRRSNAPLGTYFGQPGRFKIYVKYVNNDPALDIVQYLPAHPGTGEHGWVSYEFEVKENPNPPFELNPELDATDWEPTEDKPIKAVRAEIRRNEAPYVFTAGTKVANSVKLRIWFASLKEGTTSIEERTANFKLCQNTGYTSGFNNEEVSAIAGDGALFGGGINSKKTTETTHSFADSELESKYYISYVDYNVNSNSIFPVAGIFDLTGYIFANSGTGSPLIPYDLTFPVRVTVE